jgi:hypothetical protein
MVDRLQQFTHAPLEKVLRSEEKRWTSPPTFAPQAGGLANPLASINQRQVAALSIQLIGRHLPHPLTTPAETGTNMNHRLQVLLNQLATTAPWMSEETRHGEDGEAFIKLISLKIIQAIDSFLGTSDFYYRASFSNVV